MPPSNAVDPNCQHLGALTAWDVIESNVLSFLLLIQSLNTTSVLKRSKALC